MNNPPKTVLISGANGYFGGIACDYFRRQGWTVLKGTRTHHADLRIDLDRPEILAKTTLDTTAIDLFIHAAAAHEISCRDEPYQSIRQNIAGTRAALEFCVLNKIPKIVYLSTFHVFGNPQGLIDETKTPLPNNDYGLTHLQAEEYIQLYHRQGKVEGLVIRPSNFFGQPADIQQCKRWNLTPLGFCRAAIEKREIVLKTSGKQRRNFVAVLDICQAIEAALPHIENIPLLHLYGEDTLSIRELAELVQRIATEHLGREIQLIVPDSPSNEKDGVGNGESDFVYKSCYLEQIYKTQYRIEDFIISFCQKLINNHYE